MDYYFEDGNIILTKDVKVSRRLIAKMYPVSNLVGGEGLVNAAIAELQAQAAAIEKGKRSLMNRIREMIMPPQPPSVEFWPILKPMRAFNPLQMQLEMQLQRGPMGELLTQNIDGLTNQIKGTIETDHWRDGPGYGPGSMAFIPASASLQIHCSLEVHYLLMMSGLLDNAKAAPTEKELKTVTVKAHSVAGILNPKNLEASKADLLSAL